MPFKYASMEDRLIANSVLSEEHSYNGSRCWEWIGKRKVNASGMLYGVINVRFKSGPRKGKVKSMAAHRQSLKTFKGLRMTTKSVGRHLCNNTLCVNPEHLTGGSIRDNNRDTVKAGRHASQRA